MKKGFTLIELLVVVLIIGILSAVALPQYQKAVSKAHLAQMDTTIDAYKKGIAAYLLENGGFPSSGVTFASNGTSNNILAVDVPGDKNVATVYCGNTYCEMHLVMSKLGTSELFLQTTDTDGATWQVYSLYTNPTYKSVICQWAKERFDHTCS